MPELSGAWVNFAGNVGGILVPTVAVRVIVQVTESWLLALMFFSVRSALPDQFPHYSRKPSKFRRSEKNAQSFNSFFALR
jgi:hypothetical protein